MAGISLDEIVQVARANAAGVEQAQQRLSGLADIITGAVKSVNESTDAIAQAQPIILRTQAEGKFKTEEAIAATAKLLNVTAGDPANEYVRLAKQKLEAGREHSQALAEMAEKDSVGLLDNPFAFIFNKATRGSDIERANMAARLHNSANEQLQSLNTDAQQSFETMRQQQRTITAGSLEATITKDVAAQNIALQKLRMDAATSGTHAIMGLLNIDKAKLDNLSSAYGMQLRAQEVSIHQSQLKMAQEKHQYIIRELKQTEAWEENLGNALKIGLAKLGHAPLDGAASKAAIAELKKGGTLQPYLMDAVMAGLNDNPQAKFNGVAPLLKNQNSGAPAKLSPAEQPTLAMVKEAERIFWETQQQGKDFGKARETLRVKNMKDPAEVQQKLQASLAFVYENKIRTGFKSGDVGYVASPLNVINSVPDGTPNTQIISQLKATPLYRELFAAGGNPSPETMFQVTYEGVKSGKITLEQAKDLGSIIKLSVGVNNIQQNITGLTGYKAYEGLPVAVDIGGKREIVDISNREQVTRALVKARTREHVRESVSAGNLAF